MRYCRVCSTSVLRIVNFSSLRYVRNGWKVCTTSTKIWKNGYQAGSDRWLWSLLVDLDDIETFVLRFVIPEA